MKPQPEPWVQDENVLSALIGVELRRWLPPSVAVVTRVASALLPIPDVERQWVARAVPHRQAEFVTGRWCAHRALEKIGMPAEVIAIGKQGKPRWPEGVAGSITHESGLCAAAAVNTSVMSALGIDLMDVRRDVDVHKLSPLFSAAGDTISPEIGFNSNRSAMLGFCVKEAVVKTVSPQLDRFIEMNEITVCIGRDSFRAQLGSTLDEIDGRWSQVGPFIMAAAVMTARPSAFLPSIESRCLAGTK